MFLAYCNFILNPVQLKYRAGFHVKSWKPALQEYFAEFRKIRETPIPPTTTRGGTPIPKKTAPENLIYSIFITYKNSTINRSNGANSRTMEFATVPSLLFLLFLAIERISIARNNRNKSGSACCRFR